MGRRIEALVDAKLLTWARDNSGLGLEVAAKKARVAPGRLKNWEAGIARPTVNQLRGLAKAYKVPLGVFYLPEPPQPVQPVRDFRRLPEGAPRVQSPELRFEIRHARARREIALELYEAVEGHLPQFDAEARLSEDAEAVGARMRNLLGMTRDRQAGFRDDYEAFDAWRSGVEKAGVLVFQARGVDVSEMRGFSIGETPLPVLVVNIRDGVRARIFSMLHDFVHVLLRETGLCDLGEEGRPEEEQQVEVFCNRAAGAGMVPRDDLLQEDIVSQKSRAKGPPQWSDVELSELARRYRASRETVLRRLLICGLATQSFYKKKRAQFQKEWKPSPKGFAPPARAAVSTAGKLLVRLVLDAYYRANITASDVCDYLGVRFKHVGEIEREVMGASRRVGETG